MVKIKMACIVHVVLLLASIAFTANINVSQPIYGTNNNAYDRNPSIIYDGANYWLFFTKGDNTSTDGVRGPTYDPDADNYIVYYKTAATIDGLAGVSETKLLISETNRPAGFDQRVVSAAAFDGNIYAFVSSGQSGTDRGLYYYEYSGGSWTGPVTLIADATARGGHVNVVATATRIYIVWESSDGSSDCYTWDGGTLSSKVDIDGGNQPKITYYEQNRSGNLFVVNIEDGTGDIEVYWALASPNPLFSHHSTAIPGGGFYDPCIFTDGTDLYVISAPWVANDRQYLIQTKFDVSISTWSDTKVVSYGGYGDIEWWDYWPCGYHDGSDVYVFYTTETSSPEFSDGEIAYFKMDWDLANDHYFYVQNAVDQASSGDEISIDVGSYLEQVVVTTDNLTLSGSARGIDPVTSTIIKSPGTLSYYFTTGDNNNFPVVGIDGVASCLIRNLTVDGDNQGDNNYRFDGIAFWNAGGTVNNVDVLNIMNSTFSGAQHGVGIYSYNNTGGPYIITLDDVLIDDFQKNAVALLGNGLSYDIDDVTCIGQGPTDVTAQNGIQVGSGASGTIDNCTITGVDWTGGTWTASGLLPAGGNFDAFGVSIDQCQTSVYAQDAGGTFENGLITNPTGDGFYAYNSSSTLSSSPRLVPQPIDADLNQNISLTVMDIEIINSTITGQNLESSWGVGAFSTSTDPVNLTITGCFISNWDYGVYAYDYGGPVNVTVYDNSITSCTYAAGSNMTNIQNASGNWYGTIDPVNLNLLFEGDVDYTPWLNIGDDTDLITPGFQGDFSTLWVDDDSPQTGAAGYIEEGINLVSGSTVNIVAGTYREQLYIDQSLDLIGSGSETCVLEAPDAVDRSTYSITQWTGDSRTIDAIIGVNGAGTVNISGFTVDGRDLGPDNFYGVHFFNTSGSVTECVIDNITDAAYPSRSRVVSLVATHGLGETFTIEFSNLTIPVFQKGGIAIMGPGATFTVNENQVVNVPSPVIAGNGIQLSYGATGTTYQNVVEGAAYTGEDWAATGILLFESGNVSMDGDEVYNCQSGVNFSDWGWIYEHPTPVNLGFTDLNLYDNEWTLGAQLSRDNCDPNITITGCDILSSSGDGIDIWGTGPSSWYTGWNNGDLNVIIDDCNIRNTALDGIWTGDLSGNANNVASFTVFHCDFTDNVGSAINNTFSQTIDATRCYWNAVSGPVVGTLSGSQRTVAPMPKPFGVELPETYDLTLTGATAERAVGETIYGPILYDPWCSDETHTNCELTYPITEAWVDDSWEVLDDGDYIAGHLFGYDAFATIGDALEVIAIGGTINVAAGEYVEQVVITKDNLFILGAGPGSNPSYNTIIKSPENLSYSFNSGYGDNFPVIGIDGVSGVSISGITVDGDNQGDSNYRFCGITFWNAGGSISGSEIRNVMNSTFSGAQHGVGIYAQNNTGGPYTITLDAIYLEHCQKTHVALSGVGLTVDINNVTTIGEGATGITAQNGIQVGSGAGGTVDDCIITGFAYTGLDWTASGLLLLNSTEPIVATNVDIDQCQTSVYFSDAGGTFAWGSITDPLGDALYALSYGALRSDVNKPKVQPDPFDGISNIQSDRSPVDVTVSHCVITGADVTGSWGPAGYAIGPVTFTVVGCEVSHWDWGVVAYDAGGGITSNADSCKIYDNLSYGLFTNDIDILDAEHNWWGVYCGPYHPTLNPDGEGNAVSDNVDFDPWCDEEFVNCTFSAGDPAPAEVWVDDDYAVGLYNDGHFWCIDAFATIQDGVDAVADGGIVNVAEGIYREQVKIEGKGLDLIGVGVSTSIIEAVETENRNPYVIAQWNGSNKTIDACVGIVDAGEVNISGFTVDGRELGPSDFYGICYFNTDGAVTNCRIEDITSSGNPSTQSIVSVLVTHGIGQTVHFEFTSNTIPNLQKGGFVTMGPGVNVTATDNVITGFMNPSLAPNGIQISYGSYGILTGNNVTGVGYPGEDWAGTCILLFESGDVTVTGGIVDGCEMGINHSQWNWRYTPTETPTIIVEGVVMDENQWSVATHLANDGVNLNLEVIDCIINNSLYSGVDLWGSDQDPWGGNYYSGWTNGTLNVTITDNHITNSGDAIVENVVLPTGNAVNCTAIRNDYSGYADYGVYNNFTNMIDATQCFWGDQTGPLSLRDNRVPRHLNKTAIPFAPEKIELPEALSVELKQTDDDGMILDEVTSNVDYSPWWGGNYVHDDHSSAWTWYLDNSNSSTIMEGVDLAVNDDTVFATPAIYTGPGNKNIDFGGKTISLIASGSVTNTIINCELSGRAFHFHSGETEFALVKGFTIKNGGVPYDGGAVYCENSSAPTLANCLIIGNIVNGFGGAIACDGASNMKIINCTISKNTAYGQYNSGGGIYCFDSSPIIKNTIIYENYGAGQNQIYNHTMSDYEPVVTYCDIQGGWPGSGNIDTDPLFRSADLNDPDFHLMAIACGDAYDSPCIDIGHPNIEDLVLDCDNGLATILSDMGAYGGGYIKLGLSYYPGDANMYNGAWPPTVIGSDVTYLVNYFRGIETSLPCYLDEFWCSADANGDCNIIGSDVTRMVNYFRGEGIIGFCIDHTPLWLTPDDLPVEAPEGWPNCETTEIISKVRKTNNSTE